MQHVRFIVSGSFAWGAGETLEVATKRWKRALSREYKRTQEPDSVYRFESDLPFAASDRNATERESDAFVAADGSLSWIRCQRHDITPEKKAGKALAEK